MRLRSFENPHDSQRLPEEYTLYGIFSLQYAYVVLAVLCSSARILYSFVLAERGGTRGVTLKLGPSMTFAPST
jgi:hypothetical protein